MTAPFADQTRRRSIALLAALLVALVLTATPALAGAQEAAAGGGKDPFTLTLLHNNDGESQLLPSTDGNVGGWPGSWPRCASCSARASGNRARARW